MNLLNELAQTLSPNDKAIARIIGKKAEGIWTASTLSQAVVVLTGQAGQSDLLGKQVYYNRSTGQILGIAPDVVFASWGV